MTLELKAYKCVFIGLFEYSSNPLDNENECELIYGINQKEAVTDKCKLDENHTFWEMKKHIRTRRLKKMDLFSQKKDSSLLNLSDIEINHLTHSLGVQIGDVCPDNFYRNYSMYRDKHEKCDKLVKLGLMSNWQNLGSEVYGVTEKGVEAVKTLLLVTNQNIN